MLLSLNEILPKTFKSKYAIPQPDFVNLDLAASYLKASSKLNSPIILGFGEEYINVSGSKDLQHLTRVIESLSAEYDIPVVLHLDHGNSYEVCRKAIKAGFGSVMIDGSSLPYEENLNLTKEVVQMAKKSNVSVEGELGSLKAGKGYDLAKGSSEVFTEPNAAKEFVEKTKVDALAVSIGNAHGEYTGPVDIDFDLLKRIKNATQLPLVLHGASGISSSTLQKLSKEGISKVNIFTDFVKGIDSILQEKYQNSYNEKEILNIPNLLDEIQNEIFVILERYVTALGSGLKL